MMPDADRLSLPTSCLVRRGAPAPSPWSQPAFSRRTDEDRWNCRPGLRSSGAQHRPAAHPQHLRAICFGAINRRDVDTGCFSQTNLAGAVEGHFFQINAEPAAAGFDARVNLNGDVARNGKAHALIGFADNGSVDANHFAAGKVIGINTAIVGESYQGVSFAIPSNVAVEIYSRIKAGRGWLGVYLEEMTPTASRQVGLTETTGVYVTEIYLYDNKSPAGSAGVQPGDIVLRWNDDPVGSASDLRRLVEKTPVGSKAKVLVRRGERDLTLEVTVGQRPASLPNESRG